MRLEEEKNKTKTEKAKNAPGRVKSELLSTTEIGRGNKRKTKNRKSKKCSALCQEGGVAAH